MDRKSKWFIGGCAFVGLAIAAFVNAWGERRIVGAFAEELVAGLLFVLGVFGGPIIGFYTAGQVAVKTERNWLGYVCGFAVFILISLSCLVIGKSIPGVDHRIERYLGDE